MDYEVSDVYQSDDDDDTIAHFALFSDCDPISFQEAVKEPKWQKPMDAEILALRKMNMGADRPSKLVEKD
ncbi:hypothetical protein Prudu_009639 [Prunus dulcis]|uniref:Uncharacterized protein n=1 Tax=Prunus dulcis TaxID=3755 RepID=A0A4Y1R6R5_PRUDU|nr:hypothetical protein Prudu_009639 [Prunus dulcis]